MVTPDAETHHVHVFWALRSTFSTDELEEAVVADSRYLYVEGYFSNF